MRFKGKVAIVTGGSRGIGRAIVLRLAGEGAKVALCGRRDDDEAASVVARAKAIGGGAVFFRADITDRADVSNFVQGVEEALGHVDILVNNVGAGSPGRFLENDDATIDETIEISLKGPIYVTKAVLPGMVERGAGKIVNIASDSGRVGGAVVYSAAKGGVIAFTKALAREMARHKINVNCVSPGLTSTAGLMESMAGNPKRLAALNKSNPLGRMAEPEEIAAAVAFLVSDEAAYITGQTLSVSGGATMV